MSDAIDTPPTAQQLVGDLVRLLTVERTGPDNFVGGQQKNGVGRMFGGQVIAQALQAAQATVDNDKQAHSLHAYFLRGGKEGVPTHYSTARDFDGRSFANRRVVAMQDGVPILNLTASFQAREQGVEHDEAPMPDVPGPDDLRDDMELRREYAERAGLTGPTRDLMLRARPIEMRTSGKLHWMNKIGRAHV